MPSKQHINSFHNVLVVHVLKVEGDCLVTVSLVVDIAFSDPSPCLLSYLEVTHDVSPFVKLMISYLLIYFFVMCIMSFVLRKPT